MQAESKTRAGSTPTVEQLLKTGLPVTVENWLGAHYLGQGRPEKVDPEILEQANSEVELHRANKV